MRIQAILAVGIFGFCAGGPVLAEIPPPDATFQRTEPANAVLALTREDGEWFVYIRAGGLPNGAATAVDCELGARGMQNDEGVISARLVPFEGELTSQTEADLVAVDVVIEVAVGPEGAFVVDGGASLRLCGMGSDIDGFYARDVLPE
jgi:hypothetical protein